MPQHYYTSDESRPYKDFSTRGKIIFWLIMILVVVPFFAFFAGMTVSAMFPPIGKLISPLACANGTLQFNNHTFQNGYSTSYSPTYDCLNSATGKSENVSTTIDYIGGGVVAVVGCLEFGLLVILIGAIRLLTGRSFV
jgi:hypothetical protein